MTPPTQPLPVDPAVPSPARVWNYWLGGTDNFPVDRELAERIMAAMPSMPLIARFARLFLADAVGRLSEFGIRQFLDIGSGVPTADNTHQVAQRLAPESRVVYADRDPTVASHARSLLSSAPEGKTDYLHADLRDPEAILDAAGRTLDLTRSVGVLLIGVLHFIPGADDPYGIVARLMAGLPSGSYLVIGHAASDLAPEAAAEMTRRNNQTSPVPITPRTRAEVTRFFDGLDLMPPGVVPISEWDLGGAMDTTIGDLVGYAGLARKP
jgi:S-adenosyl methyltransferase